MVTAETAVALPALVVLLGGLLVLVAAVSGQLRCVDAAREGARSAARGDPPGTVVQVTRSAAPPGAQITVSRAGAEVTVTVTARTRVLGRLGGSVTVRASATSRLEPTEDDEGPTALGPVATVPAGVRVDGRHVVGRSP